MFHVFYILLSRIDSVELAIVDITILIVLSFEEKGSRHDNMTNTRNQSSFQEFDNELEIYEIQQVNSRQRHDDDNSFEIFKQDSINQRIVESKATNRRLREKRQLHELKIENRSLQRLNDVDARATSTKASVAIAKVVLKSKILKSKKLKSYKDESEDEYQRWFRDVDI